MNIRAKKIETTLAPKVIGPYSQGVSIASTAELIFVSGQIPINPATGQLIQNDIRSQTHQVIDNIQAILQKEESDLNHILRVEIFLKDLKKDFAPLNEVYAERFNAIPAPARQTVQVSDLPMGAPIEISCIAYKRVS